MICLCSTGMQDYHVKRHMGDYELRAISLILPEVHSREHTYTQALHFQQTYMTPCFSTDDATFHSINT